MTSSDKADAISALTKKFLREIKGFTNIEATKTACVSFIELVDNGVFTPLPNEIRKNET